MASSPVPSPPPPASETRGGLLTKLQQKIAGLKTFVHGLAVYAGTALHFNDADGDATLTYSDPYLTSSKALKVTSTGNGAGLVLPSAAGLDFGTLRLKVYDASGVPTLSLPDG